MLRQNLYLFSDVGLQRVQAGSLGTRVLMSRSVCSYSQLTCAGVPWFKLRQYAQLHARQLAVYVDTGVYALKQGDKLHLWMWDAQALRDALTAQGVGTKAGRDPIGGVRIVPQSALKLTGPADGTALFASGSGFEGVSLRSGVLHKNHWWAELPVGEEWQRFSQEAVTQVGLTASTPPTAVPAVKQYNNMAAVAGWGWQVSMAKEGSLASSRTALQAGRLGWPAKLCAGLLAVSCGGIAYLGVLDWHLRQAQQALTAQLAAAGSTASAQVKAREVTQNVADRVKALASFGQVVLPQELWAQWAADMVLLGVSVREFELRAGQIRMLVVANSGKLDPTAVLAVVAKDPQITDVKIDLNSALQDMRITAVWQGKSK